eukprot:572527_1
MAEPSSDPSPAVSTDEKTPLNIQRKREFTLHEKRISETMQLDFLALYDDDKIEFRKKTAAMLRENPDLFNLNEIGTVADTSGHVSLEQWEGYLNDLIKPELSKKIFECIDHDNKGDSVAQTAITRFLSGRTRVADRPKTIIDEAWLVHKLKDVDIGKIDEQGNNRIGMKDFKNYFSKLKKEVPDDIVEKLFYDIDTNQDGSISTFEYFKWKENFKMGVIKQYDPAKIRKSTTNLTTLNSGSKRGKDMKVRFGDEADQMDEEMTKLKATVARLRAENVEQDALINEKDTEIAKIQAENDRLKQSVDTKDTSTQTDNENMKQLEEYKTRVDALEKKAETDKKDAQKLIDRVVELENQLQDKETLAARVEELEGLLNESQGKVKENETLKDTIKDKDALIKEYEAKMEALQNEYQKQMESNEQGKVDSAAAVAAVGNGDDDVMELRKTLVEKDELIEKIKHENEAEMAMMTRDKDNLYEQLEETYSIVNEELVEDKKYNKKAKKRKVIETSGDLRKKLKKLKSKIDVKDQKIKQYKSQRMLSHHDAKVQNEEEEVQKGLEETKDEDAGLFSFIDKFDKKTFIFLKDF